MIQQLKALVLTLRPKQWTKNAFVLAALIFDGKVFSRVYLTRALLGVLLFCAISGAIYTLNDLLDKDKDRQHPTKRHRPIASGALHPALAWGAVAVLITLSLGLGYRLSPTFALILLGYALLQLTYTLLLKHIVLLDVLSIAAGFVLRVGAGVVLVDALRFSPWLYICTTFLALFLALGKRRGELVLLAAEAGNHRVVLDDYTLPLLDQLITLVSACTILAYALYTILAPNLPENHLMLLTIPFVVYGIFRYMYVVQVRHCTAAPDELLLSDVPLLVDLVLWGGSVVWILYFVR